jgi:hypothetical protein
MRELQSLLFLVNILSPKRWVFPAPSNRHRTWQFEGIGLTKLAGQPGFQRHLVAVPWMVRSVGSPSHQSLVLLHPYQAPAPFLHVGCRYLQPAADFQVLKFPFLILLNWGWIPKPFLWLLYRTHRLVNRLSPSDLL